MKRTFLALMVLALFLGAGTWFASAQQSGGAFIPTFAYSGIYNFPRLFLCGTSTTCANTDTAMTAHAITGFTTLTAGTATVTGISPAFSSTANMTCTAVDTSGASGVAAEAIPASTTSVTLNGTGAGTVAWMCLGK